MSARTIDVKELEGARVEGVCTAAEDGDHDGGWAVLTVRLSNGALARAYVDAPTVYVDRPSSGSEYDEAKPHELPPTGRAGLPLC